MLHIKAQETYRARIVMNDLQQNLVEVRRSSGQKEWMTKEKLEALNKLRALQREKTRKAGRAITAQKKLTAISIWLNGILVTALLMILLYQPIDLIF